MSRSPRPTTTWILPDDSAPLRHVREAFDQTHGTARAIHWLPDADGGRSYGRTLTLPTRGTGYAMSIKAISPMMLVDLVRRSDEVVVVLELDLAGLYAIATKLLRPGRRVVAMVEGDLGMLGPTGSAGWKMRFRRLIARFVDAFATNNAHATRYVVQDLGVPRAKVHEGWWLAGFPDSVPAEPPPEAVLARRQGPTFLTVGQLIPRKGHAALIRAAARYKALHGPCQVWILGEGPDRPALEALISELDMGAEVELFGQVDRAQVRGAMEASDLFVFPTFNDLVGRALVEAVSTGTPVVVSDKSGAIGTLLHDGRDCVVVDPDDPDDLLRGLAVAADASRLAALRQGAAEAAESVTVTAAASAVAAAVNAA